MNPLMQMMGGVAGGVNMQAVQQIKQAMNMFKAMQNPQQALMQAARQNPALNSVMQMCNGKNPQEVFYSECQKSGVDPESVLKLLR